MNTIGPFDVVIDESICAFFGVGSIEEITPELLSALVDQFKPGPEHPKESRVSCLSIWFWSFGPFRSGRSCRYRLEVSDLSDHSRRDLIPGRNLIRVPSLSQNHSCFALVKKESDTGEYHWCVDGLFWIGHPGALLHCTSVFPDNLHNGRYGWNRKLDSH